jgi:2-amino-4-hydroxy-6-hydroxymethyldihydropteridine diphosphokinase
VIQSPLPALIGFGANLPFRGEPPELTIRRALARLDSSPGIRLTASSSLWVSRPIQAEGPDFINGVAEIRCSLEPEALMAQLLEVEAEFGRVRSARPADAAPARTLDLDLLWMNGIQRCSPELVLPHPRAQTRAFVLAPLAELRPCLRLGQDADSPTVEELLAGLLRHDPQSVARLERPSVRSA